MAISAATVMKLRSRLESPGRSHTSPKSTFSLRSMSFGATCRTTSRAVGTEACVLTVCSFRGDEVVLRGELYALPAFDASRRRASIPPPFLLHHLVAQEAPHAHIPEQACCHLRAAIAP